MTLEEVYQFYGNATRAAEAVNVSRQTFHAWIRKGFIPFNQQQRYEKLSDGKLKAQKYPEKVELGQKKTTFAKFRYYSDKFGMCDVQSLTYFGERKPRIIYYCPSDRRIKFSSFQYENLMQSSSLVDSNNVIVFENDIILLKGRELILKSLYDYPVLDLLSKEDDFLIIGNEFERKSHGYKRS